MVRWLILTVLVSCVGFALSCLGGGGGGGGGGSGNSGSGNNGVQLPGCPTIITRSQWGARSPKQSTKMSSTPSYALIHHGTGPRCYTQNSCTNIVKSYQQQHMDVNGWDDIGYNFIVGEDGNVYEGRGWDIVGAHAGDNGYNQKSLGICVIGDFSTVLPNSAAQNAVKGLLSCAESNNKLSTFYILRGHRDVRTTECPGQRFYDLIKTWNRY